MKSRLNRLISFLGSEGGATATEYSVMTGFVALIIVFGVGLFGTALNGYFGDLTNGLKAALGLP
ncbi:Flp family type IVb pilin [Arthrobacter silvisoli]|uniref:Flp family type IVb pilin n=1 Tax=Arthrobacter silvisoli TaxID=2291022 RepID=UPI000E214C47|nr:Flp family type IVb pilin [Arthrobacter silvisoli]